MMLLGMSDVSIVVLYAEGFGSGLIQSRDGTQELNLGVSRCFMNRMICTGG